MAKKALVIVTKEAPPPKQGEECVRIWRERDLSEEELFQGTDEAGRTGWFLRLTLTGMYPRRIGPYDSKEEALELHQAVVAEFVMDTLTDIHNDLECGQVSILEGVPRLIATT